MLLQYYNRYFSNCLEIAAFDYRLFFKGCNLHKTHFQKTSTLAVGSFQNISGRIGLRRWLKATYSYCLTCIGFLRDTFNY